MPQKLFVFSNKNIFSVDILVLCVYNIIKERNKNKFCVNIYIGGNHEITETTS